VCAGVAGTAWCAARPGAGGRVQRCEHCGRGRGRAPRAGVAAVAGAATGQRPARSAQELVECQGQLLSLW